LPGAKCREGHIDRGANRSANGPCQCNETRGASDVGHIGVTIGGGINAPLAFGFGGEPFAE